MTLLDIVSLVSPADRVTVSGDEILVDCFPAEKLLTDNYFQEELADKEVRRIGIGLFNELVLFIAE